MLWLAGYCSRCSLAKSRPSRDCRPRSLLPCTARRAPRRGRPTAEPVSLVLVASPGQPASNLAALPWLCEDGPGWTPGNDAQRRSVPAPATSVPFASACGNAAVPCLVLGPLGRGDLPRTHVVSSNG